MIDPSKFIHWIGTLERDLSKELIKSGFKTYYNEFLQEHLLCYSDKFDLLNFDLNILIYGVWEPLMQVLKKEIESRP